MLCEFLNRRKLKKTRKRLHSLAFCNSLKIQSNQETKSNQQFKICEVQKHKPEHGIYRAIYLSNEDFTCTDTQNIKSDILSKETYYDNGILSAILSTAEGSIYSRFVKYRPVECSLSYIVSRIIHSLDQNNLFVLDTVIRTSVCINDLNSCSLSPLKSQRIPPKTEYDSHCVFLKETELRQLERKPSTLCSGIRNIHPNKFFKFTSCIGENDHSKSILNIDCLLVFHCNDQFMHDDIGYTLELDYPEIYNYHLMANMTALRDTSMLYFDPVFGACKAWRWPDLKSGEWLRRLPFCRCKSTGLQRQICINPYHWNRVITSMSLRVNSGTAKLTYPMEIWSQDPDLVSVGLNVGEAVSGSDVCSGVVKPAAPSTHHRQDDQPKDRTKIRPPSPLDEREPLTINYVNPILRIAEYSESNVNLERPLLWDQCNCSINGEASLSSASTESTFLRDDASKILNLSSFSYTSSLSSNQEESSSEGRKAKKPRSCPSAVGGDGRGRQIPADKAWARLSYWEGHRHVGISWYKLHYATIRICYEDESGARLVSRMEDKQHGIKSIYLSRLPDWTAISKPTGTHAFVYSQSSYPQSRGAAHAGKSRGACQNEAYTPPSSAQLLSVKTLSRISDRHMNVCSWRQCSRLGYQGISLTVTPLGQVWLNNQSLQSNMPVFVSSPCLFHEETPQTADKDRPVFRVPAGFSLLIFDRAVYNAEMDMSTCGVSHESICPVGGVAVRTNAQLCQPPCPVVHISLGKGWGARYRRPDITHCPARLELWINVDYWPMQVASRAQAPM